MNGTKPPAVHALQWPFWVAITATIAGALAILWIV
jgi:hypothetical protein